MPVAQDPVGRAVAAGDRDLRSIAGQVSPLVVARAQARRTIAVNSEDDR